MQCSRKDETREAVAGVAVTVERPLPTTARKSWDESGGDDEGEVQESAASAQLAFALYMCEDYRSL